MMRRKALHLRRTLPLVLTSGLLTGAAHPPRHPVAIRSPRLILTTPATRIMGLKVDTLRSTFDAPPSSNLAKLALPIERHMLRQYACARRWRKLRCGHPIQRNER